jgi:trigger factor
MNLNYQYQKEGVNGKITLTINKGEFLEKYEKILNEYLPKIQIKGFRPGKAPKTLVEAKYGNSLKYETFKELISESYNEILKKENITPINEPEVDFDNKELDLNKDINVTCKFELPAEAKICDLKEIKISYDKFEVSEKDVENELKAYQKNYSTLELKETPSSNGDYININLQIFDENNNKIKELPEYTLIIGDNFLKLNIDEDLINLKKGDKKEIIKDYTNADNNIDNEFKGKKVKIVLSVNEVKERKYPELDDNFAKDYSEFQTLNDWKNEIKAQLERYAKDFEKNYNLRKIYDAIIEKSEFLIPETYIKIGINRAFESYKKQFNITDDVFNKLLNLSGREKEGFIYSFRPSTIKDIQIELIQLEFLKKIEPKVDENDYKEFIKEEALKTKKSSEEIEKEVNKYKRDVEFFIKLRKIENYLLENVSKVEGKTYHLEDINKLIEERNKEEDKKTQKAYEEWLNLNKNDENIT